MNRRALLAAGLACPALAASTFVASPLALAAEPASADRADALVRRFMAATAPAEFLGLGAARGSLVVGQRADIVWLDKALDIQGTFIGASVDEALAA